MGKRPLLVLRFYVLFIGIFAEHFYVAPQRKGGDEIFGLPYDPAYDLRSKSEGKLQDLYPEKLGKQKMTKLMDKDQNT